MGQIFCIYKRLPLSSADAAGSGTTHRKHGSRMCVIGYLRGEERLQKKKNVSLAENNRIWCDLYVAHKGRLMWSHFPDVESRLEVELRV